MQLRQMEIVTDEDKLKVDIQQVCAEKKTIKQFAYILHDKDDTRPHYHIYLNFGKSSCDTKLVANWFQVPENFIEKVKGRKVDALLYLTHRNESQKQKHQYELSEVISNFDVETEIKQSQIIGDFKNYSYAQMLTYIDSLPVSEKKKSYSLLKTLWEIECKCSSLNTDRQLDVMFITGGAGTGKTYYAKKFLNNLKYDFYVSSSSNDPFQDYMGQKAIILDDLRDESFKFEDFLKMIDNNTQSSVASRFQNKVFVGKMIVITSSVPLFKWYATLKFDGKESLQQLYRRIGCYVDVSEKSLTVYSDGLNEYGHPIGSGKKYRNELFELKKQKRETFGFEKVFDEICDNETLVIQETFNLVDDDPNGNIFD